MIGLGILLIIVGIIIFVQGSKNLALAQEIKNTKEEEIRLSELKLKQNYDELNRLYNEQNEIIQAITKEKEKFTNIYIIEKKRISEQIQLYKDNTSYASEQYLLTLEKAYEEAEDKYYKRLEVLESQQNIAAAALEKIKDALSAATEAQLREREIAEQLDFYKLSLTTLELEDVKKLNSIKYSLHQPIILNKLIWSTYFQKQTTDMCNRILGKDRICGIYKITNLETKQSYIGQSVDVAQRWKDHVKCGLGIEASATNRLYKAMQEDGVWNFTFELLETCSRDELNEKERLWIAMYKTDSLGYNSTKGNS